MYSAGTEVYYLIGSCFSFVELKGHVENDLDLKNMLLFKKLLNILSK